MGVPGETSTIMKVFAVLLLAALAYAAPRPNLRLMPPLMPGTHTTVTVIPDTTVPTATVLDMDGVDTMVDITGTPDTDTDTGSVMLKLKLNLRLRLKPTLPSSTPASTAMDLPTD